MFGDIRVCKSCRLCSEVICASASGTSVDRPEFCGSSGATSSSIESPANWTVKMKAGYRFDGCSSPCGVPPCQLHWHCPADWTSDDMVLLATERSVAVMSMSLTELTTVRLVSSAAGRDVTGGCTSSRVAHSLLSTTSKFSSTDSDGPHSAGTVQQ